MADTNTPGWSLFGFEFKRQPKPDTIKSFTPEVKDDGAVVVAAGGMFNQYIDLDGTVRTEAELVAKYRQMALQPEVDAAINQIVNDAIVVEEGEETVKIILDKLPFDDKVKQAIEEEFKGVLDLLDYNNNCYTLFRRWYIEGRQYFHVVIDEAAPQEGIQELRYIDSRKIRKIREVTKTKDPRTDAVIQKTRSEYYLYSDRGMNYGSKVIGTNIGTTGVKIKPDSIIHITSGLTDENMSVGLSYLHAAIKPLNQLRTLEDSTIIYHMSRAPERRVFSIDVGNLPKIKADQHMRDLMTQYKNRLSYNAQTGEIRDDRKYMTMLEDFWLPRRENGQGTQISVLSGGTQLTQLLETVEYFKERLYSSLYVPISRLRPDTLYSLGRATEISRDEVDFGKFIDRLRTKYSQLFIEALGKQLILKAVILPDEWDLIKNRITFRFLRDNYWAELKERQIFNDRVATVMQVDPTSPIVGKYVSFTWIRKFLLKQSDEDMEMMDAQIYEDMKNPLYNQGLIAAAMEQQQQMQDQQQDKGGK
jgi:hypothetical protein